MQVHDEIAVLNLHNFQWVLDEKNQYDHFKLNLIKYKMSEYDDIKNRMDRDFLLYGSFITLGFIFLFVSIILFQYKITKHISQNSIFSKCF